MKIQNVALDALDVDSWGKTHPKPYMTSRFGRALERASYRDLALITLSATTLFTLYFSLAPTSWGIPQSDDWLARLCQALYFTVVTATSLGYGDIAPQGLGRFVASSVVIFGLAMVAVVIGKIASERSQATLFLLHTSDRERRLRGFAEEIAQARERLSGALREQESEKANAARKEIAVILESASNYIYFHAHHSNLGDYGNAPALYRLLTELRNLPTPIFAAMLTPKVDLASYKRFDSLLARIDSTFKAILVMQSVTRVDWTAVILARFRKRGRPAIRLSKGQIKLFDAFTQEMRVGMQRLARQITIEKLNKVLSAVQAGPLAAWPKGDHKRVASQLGISNSLASECIKQLVEQGRLPK